MRWNSWRRWSWWPEQKQAADAIGLEIGSGRTKLKARRLAVGESLLMPASVSWWPCTTKRLSASSGNSFWIWACDFPVLPWRAADMRRFFWFLSVWTHLVPMILASSGRSSICCGERTSTDDRFVTRVFLACHKTWASICATVIVTLITTMKTTMLVQACIFQHHQYLMHWWKGKGSCETAIWIVATLWHKEDCAVVDKSGIRGFGRFVPIRIGLVGDMGCSGHGDQVILWGHAIRRSDGICRDLVILEKLVILKRDWSEQGHTWRSGHSEQCRWRTAGWRSIWTGSSHPQTPKNRAKRKGWSQASSLVSSVPKASSSACPWPTSWHWGKCRHHSSGHVAHMKCKRSLTWETARLVACSPWPWHFSWTACVGGQSHKLRQATDHLQGHQGTQLWRHPPAHRRMRQHRPHRLHHPVLHHLLIFSCARKLNPHRVADLAEVILIIVDGAQDGNLLLGVEATEDQQHHRSKVVWHPSSGAWLLKFAEVLLTPNNIGLHAFGRSPPHTRAIEGLQKQLIDFHWHVVRNCWLQRF